MVLCFSREIVLKKKKTPGLQFITADRLSLVSPPRSNGRTIPLSIQKCIFITYCTVVRHSTALSYPSIENLFNGCQGHPLSVCHQGPPSGYRTGFKKCSDAQQFIQLTVIGDINAKSCWSLKTEKIHLLWHAYIDTTHTLRHLFLTWTSLYLSTFLKT